MPTIEVGEFDKVFIVRRQAAPPRPPVNQVVELDENAFVLTIQKGQHFVSTNGGTPHRSSSLTKFYVNGDQIGLVQGIRIEASADNSDPVMDFSIVSPDAPGISPELRQACANNLNNLRRLLPVATIRELGLAREVIAEYGSGLPPRGEPVYNGPRPSRFERVLEED